MRIINHTQNTVLAEKATCADTFFSRMRGLLGRKSLSAGEALVITRCNSIHMFFMQFPIDVIFIDKENIVVGLLKKIQPNTLSPIFWSSSKAVELPAGTLEFTRTSSKDKICFEETK